VAPWTEWDANNPKGEALPSSTVEEKAVVRQLKKQIGKWLEDDRPTRQQADQIGAIRSTSAYVGLLRSMWRLGLSRNEEELLGWDWETRITARHSFHRAGAAHPRTGFSASRLRGCGSSN